MATALEPLSPGEQTQDFLPSPGPDPAPRSPSSFLCVRGTPHPNKALIKGKKRGKAETFPARKDAAPTWQRPRPPPCHLLASRHRRVHVCKGKSGDKINPGTGRDAIQHHRSLGCPGPGAGCRAGCWQGAGPGTWRRCQARPPDMGILPPGARRGSLPHPNVAFVFRQGICSVPDSAALFASHLCLF